MIEIARSAKGTNLLRNYVEDAAASVEGVASDKSDLW